MQDIARLVAEAVKDENGTEHTVCIEEDHRRAGYRLWIGADTYLIDPESIRGGYPSVSMEAGSRRLKFSREVNGDRVTCCADAETDPGVSNPLGMLCVTFDRLFLSLGISGGFHKWVSRDLYKAFPGFVDSGAFFIEKNSPVACFLGRKSLDYATMRLNVRDEG